VANRLPIVYWDACLFIAWIKDEFRSQDEMDGLNECVSRVTSGALRIVTLEQVRLEVLKGSMGDEAEKRWTALFKNRSVQELPMDKRVLNLAEEILTYYRNEKQKDPSKMVMTPLDAAHCAGAIRYSVDALYTFDKGKQGKSLGLLGLNGNVAGHKLVISKPPVTWPTLGLRYPTP
jgi:predicted nucleic acid-binding protein